MTLLSPSNPSDGSERAYPALQHQLPILDCNELCEAFSAYPFNITAITRPFFTRVPNLIKFQQV